MSVASSRDLIERNARQYRFAHDTFRLALRGAIMAVMGQQNPATQGSQALFDRSINAAWASLDNALPTVSLNILTIKNDALGPVLNVSIDEQIDEMRIAAYGSIEVVTRADIRTAREYLRGFRSRFKTLAVGTRTFSQAMNTTRHEFAEIEPQFRIADRSGRRWASGNYIETVMRSLGVYTYSDAAVYRMASIGHQVARIDNPGHPDHDMTFTIGPAIDGLPSYQEIRDTAFHPNSRSLPVELEPKP